MSLYLLTSNYVCTYGKPEEKTAYKYFVVVNFTDEISALYSYGEISTKIPANTLKPAFRCLCTKDDEREISEYIKKHETSHGTSARYTVTKLNGKPEYYKLMPVQFFYGPKELILEDITSPFLSNEIAEKIKSHPGRRFPVVLIGEDMKNVETNTSFDKSMQDEKRLFCTKCRTYYSPKRKSGGYWGPSYAMSCPKCDNQYNRNEIVLKEYRDFRKAHSSSFWSAPPLSLNESFYYISPDDKGICIYHLTRTVKAEKGKLIDEIIVKHMLVHHIGGEITAYRCGKKTKKPCDPFQAMQINSKTLVHFPPILYNGYPDFVPFALDNADFMKKCGFFEASKYAGKNIDAEKFFILYITLVNKYPILEQVIKVGYTALFFDIYNAITTADNKAIIKRKIDALSDLFDTETTKGKSALRIPSYIGDYLKKKDSVLDDFYAWRDIYEITHISKENFETLISSSEFALVSPYISLETLADILKFDYKTTKLLKYLVKGCNNTFEIIEKTQTLRDYLNMCDLMNVNIDKYPVNLKTVHDRTALAFKQTSEKNSALKIAKLAVQCENYVVPEEERLDDPGIPKLFKEYTVLFPRSREAFIDEGNQQHNCVGSYYRSVEGGRCVIFFIRKKETPSKSYITAECTKSGLGQLYYSNNRPVMEKEIRDFANYIAKKIIAGYKSGKIEAFVPI